MTFSQGPASFIRGLKSALALSTRGGSRVPELGTLGSVRGALSNERPYRDLRAGPFFPPDFRVPCSWRPRDSNPNSGFVSDRVHRSAAFSASSRLIGLNGETNNLKRTRARRRGDRVMRLRACARAGALFACPMLARS